ncbi:dihydrolipoamide acetyltransferase family protein [Falsibacillus pallidus]|uniref:Dihydrolipoamide acetyltransferase component of pyruvate dehydrogenase complex n=1 Tax=Falsibacillus pallidus TaxID=493781 RepID=A0A370H1Q4_9BACI|nr:dihydrolipoamide acetyltransferase family protein [Falsibacillus pallidus]RDI47963.1 pyruvate dehydrogenase E2 component (dihydrolipoamide acetyltransferase) [Falsibacillus pallidus]
MVELKLHDIGEGMTEGEVLHYFVKVGDQVKSDQPLVEVQTDKMTAELPSPAAGIVKEILIGTGNTVEVGTTLLIIESEGVKHFSPQAEQKLPEKPVHNEIKETAPAALLSKKRVLAAPYTRKIARELGVNIEEVKGTGPAGRVTDEDVHRFMKNGSQSTQVEAKDPVKPESKASQSAPVDLAPESIPFKGRRKQIAKKMTKSLFTIPHVSHFDEVDMTTLLAMVGEWKESNQRISIAALFIKAIGLALKDFPIFNAVLDEENEQIHLKRNINIGVAVDTEDGLIVPVIHHVEQKSIKAIHEEMKQLIEKAQRNELSAKEMTGGTFTISNVGPLGSTGATPIINHPEVGLMAFHKTKKRPVVVKDEIVIRSMMNMTMSFDHRVADGAHAVRFTNRVIELLENPSKMILEMV